MVSKYGQIPLKRFINRTIMSEMGRIYTECWRLSRQCMLFSLGFILEVYLTRLCKEHYVYGQSYIHEYCSKVHTETVDLYWKHWNYNLI